MSRSARGGAESARRYRGYRRASLDLRSPEILFACATIGATQSIPDRSKAHGCDSKGDWGMPRVLVTPVVYADGRGPWRDVLDQAGFEVVLAHGDCVQLPTASFLEQ